MVSLHQILRRKDGQGMAEYALILALVAVVAIVGLKYLGPKIYDMFQYIGGQLGR